MKIVNRNQNKSIKFWGRILPVILLLAVLACSMTSCMSGAGKITSIKKGYAITDNMLSEKNGLSALELDKLADAIAKQKTGADIREKLVAALNGYDMTAADFDDAKVADGTLAAQPEKAAAFALNVLKKAGVDTNGCVKVSPDGGEELILTAADVEALVNCFKTEVKTDEKLGLLNQILFWIGQGFDWLIRVPGFGSFIMGTLYFAIVLEILMLPLGINQQKNSRKQARLRPKEMAIRNKYKGRNDRTTQEKLNREIQELYTKEGYSPMSGCLPLLLTMPFLIFLYYIVIDPVTYIFGAPTELTSAFLTFADAPFAAGGLGLNLGSDRGTIEVLSLLRESGISLDGLANFNYFANSPECLAALDGLVESIPSFSLFGLNMGLTAGVGSQDQLILLFMPVLTFFVYWGSGKINRKFTFQPMQQTEGQDPAQGCSNKMMDWMMPAMSAWFTFMVPAAVGLYWIFKSVVSTLKQFILYKAMPLPTFTEEEYKAAERELMGKDAKNNKPAKREGGPKNSNVRSLHHIDDEDYETPAEREARLAARKAEYVEPDEETSADSKTAEGAYGDGVTLKEDDRPARKDNKKRDQDTKDE
ncbi:MAG: YidC/Oxa1 family membrane protein insertase [Ruminococcaceae bacterium]|nr:YidC/Oxa1 family membrane protein insertase [Oscillospiraceae bacterium]